MRRQIETEFDVIYDGHTFNVKIHSSQSLAYVSGLPYPNTFHRISIYCGTAEIKRVPYLSIHGDVDLEDSLAKEFRRMLMPHDKRVISHCTALREIEYDLFTLYQSNRSSETKNIPHFNVNVSMPEVPPSKQEPNSAFSEKIREWFK